MIKKRFLFLLILILFILSLNAVQANENITDDNILAESSHDIKIKEKSVDESKEKSDVEFGCNSVFVQVSASEGVTSFRRDSTSSANIFIKPVKWHGRVALKQYKTKGSYFFHSIVTSDGWLIGNGGADNPSINKKIENIAGDMVKSNKIKKSSLKEIQRCIKSLSVGHFVIKAPNGKYAIVWIGTILKGKLKPGQYISVPNGKSYYRHGNYRSFDKNPAKAAMKIVASNYFGINRRDATVFKWHSSTHMGITSSKVTAYAANEAGHLIGRSTSGLKDNIYFKNKFFSKNKLPIAPKMKLLGFHDFGSIDKLIKVKTIVNAPEVINKVNSTDYFTVLIKNKLSKKPVSHLKITLKIDDKLYTIKTNKKGVGQFNTNSLAVGKHDVLLFTNNIKYKINSLSSITIED